MNGNFKKMLVKHIVNLNDGIRLRNFLLFSCSHSKSSAENIAQILTNLMKKNESISAKGRSVIRFKCQKKTLSFLSWIFDN